MKQKKLNNLLKDLMRLSYNLQNCYNALKIAEEKNESNDIWKQKKNIQLILEYEAKIYQALYQSESIDSIQKKIHALFCLKEINLWNLKEINPLDMPLYRIINQVAFDQNWFQIPKEVASVLDYDFFFDEETMREAHRFYQNTMQLANQISLWKLEQANIHYYELLNQNNKAECYRFLLINRRVEFFVLNQNSSSFSKDKIEKWLLDEREKITTDPEIISMGDDMFMSYYLQMFRVFINGVINSPNLNHLYQSNIYLYIQANFKVLTIKNQIHILTLLDGYISLLDSQKEFLKLLKEELQKEYQENKIKKRIDKTN